MPVLRVRAKSRQQDYEIRIGRGLLSQTGQLARLSLGRQAQQTIIISNRAVFSLYGSIVVQSLKASGFSVLPFLIGDGERYKSIKTVESALQFFHEAQLERGDAVVSLGGGVVGDVTGFAASIYLRGVRYIQIPTTLLAQVDSSVGGKTGVNLSGGKNLVGSFHQPAAVIIDIETLTTLPARERVAGWCECVKQGAVSGRKLFNGTADFLKVAGREKLVVSPQLERIIAAHCAFKAAIVAQDEREEPDRVDTHSRRILNFGHTIGHALELVTNFRRFRHGEAVGHGILAASEISKNLGLLDETELELLTTTVRMCGPLPSTRDLDERSVINAIAHDKKRTAGQVKWVLLERIGRPRIVDGREISPTLLRKSLHEVFQRQSL
ncbi:MAG TPA: 3-dehydroquinate synthase [Pyrinomonadaceae bacterium]|nr:3-dehydroquinate synthase [Pyrinomonadaceae bacterium]